MKKCKRVLIIFLIIIFLIIISLLALIIRKHIIIKNIQKNLKVSQKYNNYYVKVTIDDNDNHYEEYFQIDDSNSLLRKEIVSNQKWEEYQKNNVINLYVEAYNTNKKICDLNRNVEMEKIELNNDFVEQIEKLNTFEYIKLLINLKICKKQNGYIITKIPNDIINKMIEENNEKLSCNLFINANTGLIENLKIYENDNNERKIEYLYKFDYVTNEMLQEPNVDEYELYKD